MISQTSQFRQAIRLLFADPVTYDANFSLCILNCTFSDSLHREANGSTCACLLNILSLLV